jgi:hypothetical protein
VSFRFPPPNVVRPQKKKNVVSPFITRSRPVQKQDPPPEFLQKLRKVREEAAAAAAERIRLPRGGPSSLKPYDSSDEDGLERQLMDLAKGGRSRIPIPEIPIDPQLMGQAPPAKTMPTPAALAKKLALPARCQAPPSDQSASVSFGFQAPPAASMNWQPQPPTAPAVESPASPPYFPPSPPAESWTPAAASPAQSPPRKMAKPRQPRLPPPGERSQHDLFITSECLKTLDPVAKKLMETPPKFGPTALSYSFGPPLPMTLGLAPAAATQLSLVPEAAQPVAAAIEVEASLSGAPTAFIPRKKVWQSLKKPQPVGSSAPSAPSAPAVPAAASAPAIPTAATLSTLAQTIAQSGEEATSEATSES